MSAEIDVSDEGLSDEGFADRRDRRPGETFMTTFAAIGALLLLDAGKADAALPDPKALRPIADLADPLRSASTSAGEEALGPPAVSDSAFLEAITALSPPPSLTTDWSSSMFGATNPDLVAPPDETPSPLPEQAANDAQFSVPGAIAVVGSGQSSLHFAGAAIVTSKFDNDPVFAIGNDTISVLSGGPVQSAIAPVTLTGVPTQTLGSLGYAAQADVTFNAQADFSGDRVSATSESATTSAAIPAALLVSDIVVDLSALFAFGAVYPGAFDLFAGQASGAGDGLNFVSSDPWLTVVGADKAGVAAIAASGQIRLP